MNQTIQRCAFAPSTGDYAVTNHLNQASVILIIDESVVLLLVVHVFFIKSHLILTFNGLHSKSNIQWQRLTWS